jgi:hypothetical protein
MTNKTATFIDNSPPKADAPFLNILTTEMNNVIGIDGTAIDTTGLVNNQEANSVKSYVSQAGILCTDTGSGANAYILNASSPFTNPPLKIGARLRFTTVNANTGSSTITPFGQSAITCKKSDGVTNLSSGDIPAGTEVEFIYNGTNFVKIKNQTSATSTTQGINYLSLPTNLPSITINSGAPNTTLDISAGVINYDDGSGQFVVSAMSKIIQSTGSWTAGTNQNGLDALARANSTWYQVFITKKTSDGTSDILFSTSRTSPTLPIGYTLVAWLGAMRTNASGNIDVKHFAKRTSFGQITQILTGEVATGATAVPQDDTIPQNTEGNQYMELQIIPLFSTSRLEIDVVAHLNNNAGSNTLIGFLCKDSIANALATGNYTQAAAQYEGFLSFKYTEISGSSSATTYKFRAGSYSGTNTFNGDSGNRQFGGTYASSITIKEYI